MYASDGGMDAPTPVSLARAFGQSNSAQLVLAAAEPWSRRTHELFPLAARRRAAELLGVGRLLAAQPRFAGHAVAMIDVWVYVMHGIYEDRSMVGLFSETTKCLFALCRIACAPRNSDIS